MINVQISEQEFKEIQLKRYSRSLEQVKRYPTDTQLGFEIESLLESEVMDGLGPGEEQKLQWFRDLFTWEIFEGSVKYRTEVYVSDQLVDVYCESIDQIRSLLSGEVSPDIEKGCDDGTPFLGSFFYRDLCDHDFEISPCTDEHQGVSISICNLNLRDQN